MYVQMNRIVALTIKTQKENRRSTYIYANRIDHTNKIYFRLYCMLMPINILNHLDFVAIRTNIELINKVAKRNQFDNRSCILMK